MILFSPDDEGSFNPADLQMDPGIAMTGGAEEAVVDEGGGRISHYSEVKEGDGDEKAKPKGKDSEGDEDGKEKDGKGAKAEGGDGEDDDSEHILKTTLGEFNTKRMSKVEVRQLRRIDRQRIQDQTDRDTSKREIEKLRGELQELRGRQEAQTEIGRAKAAEQAARQAYERSRGEDDENEKFDALTEAVAARKLVEKAGTGPAKGGEEKRAGADNGGFTPDADFKAADAGDFEDAVVSELESLGLDEDLDAEDVAELAADIFNHIPEHEAKTKAPWIRGNAHLRRQTVINLAIKKAKADAKAAGSKKNSDHGEDDEASGKEVQSGRGGNAVRRKFPLSRAAASPGGDGRVGKARSANPNGSQREPSLSQLMRSR